MHKIELDPYLSSHKSTNSKQIKDLNITPEILKLLEENISKNTSRNKHRQRLSEKKSLA